jgi:hypothetical protein
VKSLRPCLSILGVFSLLLSLPFTTHAEDKSTASGPRYTFSWPLDADALQPRGGSTKGAPITLDVTPSAQWQALQATGLSEFERDRRAILAMAGAYRVSFDFLEIAQFDPTAKRNAPYQSWGTEKVFIDVDTGKRISLVHILAMRIVQKDGSISEPMVTKHWRQEWQYEPTHIVEHQGLNRWQQRKLASAERKSAWSQTVYQVDESPRYASVGAWQHSNSFSTWLSGETWRPLPRREWSVRTDYQVLIGSNRHTVNATGWLQEENNLKAVLTGERSINAAQPYVAREYGVARYERIRDADFKEADTYFKSTQAFWQRVQQTWSQTFAENKAVTLRGSVDQLGLFKPLFERADEIVEKKTNSTESDTAVITTALRNMGALK